MPLVEKRYAEAFVDISVLKNEIDAFQRDLGAIAGIFGSQPDFRNFLLNPQIGIETKKNIVRRILSGETRDETLNLLLLLLDKGRVKFLPGIYNEFVKLADEKRSILNINIISAAPVDDIQVNGIAEKFRKLYNASSAKVSVEVDESLIGGVKVVIGDKLIDGTIKGRLEKLQGVLAK